MSTNVLSSSNTCTYSFSGKYTCPSGYQLYAGTNSCLSHDATMHTWIEAKIACEQSNGFLPHVVTLERQLAIQKYMKEVVKRKSFQPLFL